MMDDEQLLGAYARERSESAFGELVARHIDFVYSTALRVVNGDSPGAEPKLRPRLPLGAPKCVFSKIFCSVLTLADIYQ